MGLRESSDSLSETKSKVRPKKIRQARVGPGSATPLNLVTAQDTRYPSEILYT